MDAISCISISLHICGVVKKKIKGEGVPIIRVPSLIKSLIGRRMEPFVVEAINRYDNFEELTKYWYSFYGRIFMVFEVDKPNV